MRAVAALIATLAAVLAAPAKAACFVITSVEVDWLDDSNDNTTGCLRYAGESKYTAGELVARNAENAAASVDRQERKDAVMWLRGYLELHGTSLSADVKREGAVAGVSVRTLQRARNDLKLIVGYTGQPPVSTWSLPLDDSTSVAAH